LEARESGLSLPAPSRRGTSRHPSFAPLFTAAKQRVARMTIQVVPVRTLLEMYVAEALALEHNSFETH
jgi:hypothetical protein